MHKGLQYLTPLSRPSHCKSDAKKNYVDFVKFFSQFHLKNVKRDDNINM